MKEQDLKRLKADWYKSQIELTKKLMERTELEIARLRQVMRDTALRSIAGNLTEEKR